jgi:hypothetical protein
VTRFKEAAGRTPTCIPIERIGESLTPEEHAHMRTCARCQTELALWQQFESAAPAKNEGAAVTWIVAELERRAGSPQRQKSAPSRRWGLSGQWLAAAASVALFVSVGYLMWDREPAIWNPGGTTGQYRTAQLDVIAPLGDVAAAPREFSWKPAAGAIRYDVRILEVDGTVVWRTSIAEPRLVVPPDILSRFVIQKPFLWEVTARDTADAAIGSSGTQRFRVVDSHRGG